MSRKINMGRIMTSIGVLCERLYEARAAAGLTQQEVASRAGVSRQTVAKIENGKLENTAFGSFLKVASVLGYEVELEPQRVKVKLLGLNDGRAGPTWREENFPDYDGSWWQS
ncbi:MAG: helix-turn-helix transcriptional regulator [Coriobacteriaceae bacterium]|nr:helix-turn-helix transcriptional regulator [Coriobacteriaceae bacterium]